MQQPPWMAYAWSELGVRETAGAGSNPRIEAYIRRAGHPAAANDATAWCAAFVGACLDAAGLVPTGSLLARSYLNWGVATEAPALGVIVVLTRGSDPAQGHVGFLIGMTASEVILLGGNQADAVSVAAFDRRRILGFRLPSAATVTGAPVADPEFERGLAHVLAAEGAWSDDPFDPGGPTNKGITLAVYAREQGAVVDAGSIGRLKSELRQIPDPLVRRIYRNRYWAPAQCSHLPASLAIFHFDAAVNQGVGTAARMLQEALDVAIDGEIGPVTLAAAGAEPLATTLQRYAEIRRRRYRALSHFWRFGRGWLARVDAALAAARSRLDANSFDTSLPQPRKETPTMPDIYTDTQTSTTQQGSANPLPGGKWWGESLTIWGAVLTAVSTVAPALLAAFGINISIDLLEQLGRDGFAAIQAIAGLAGTVMTIFGRVRATTLLERRLVKVRL